MKKAIIYISSSEKKDIYIQSQLNCCLKLCKENNLNVIRIITNIENPYNINELKKEIEINDFNYIVLSSMDILEIDLKEKIKLSEELNKRSISLISVYK